MKLLSLCVIVSVNCAFTYEMSDAAKKQLHRLCSGECLAWIEAVNPDVKESLMSRMINALDGVSSELKSVIQVLLDNELDKEPLFQYKCSDKCIRSLILLALYHSFFAYPYNASDEFKNTSVELFERHCPDLFNSIGFMCS